MCSLLRDFGDASVEWNFVRTRVKWTLLRSDSELKEALESHQRVFVDMPIGLPDQESGRDCDRELRKALGRTFSSSVFSPPCRKALSETDYTSASQINAQQTGKKLSIQSWNLIPKIRQLDGLLQESKTLHGRVFESHPEWLFRLAGGGEYANEGRYEHVRKAGDTGNEPLQFKKKTPEGIEERLSKLSFHTEEARVKYEEALRRFSRADVARDDIVDAMMLAVMAAKSLQYVSGAGWDKKRKQGLPDMPFEGLRAFPEFESPGDRQQMQRDSAGLSTLYTPPTLQRDSTGLPKAIWYPVNV